MRYILLAAVAFLLVATGPETKPAATTQSAEDVKLNDATRLKLNKLMPQLRFNAVGFGDLIDFMKDFSGINIIVRWDQLKSAGIDKNTPVSMNLRGSRFGDALTVLLIQAAGKPGVITYTIEHGEIIIVPINAPATQPK